LYSTYTSFDFLLLAKIIIASVAFGLASYLFAYMVHAIKAFFIKRVPKPWVIPVIGGLIIIGLTALVGKPDYLSLGIDPEHAGAVTIPSAFSPGGADTWSWLWKTIYTTTTLATGFKGGEVTPLFYIGATLGNTLSVLMDAPVSLFAALGFIAVFAGATNTPLACTFMGIELFGSQYALFFAVACFTAYFFSGHSGIYGSQRIGIPKTISQFSDSATISEAGSRRLSYVQKKLEKYKLKAKDKKD
jgi:H+/Cl- antiporter ClcA